jgi:uncharacterized membrane protein HdeD (DUF308 family)
MFKKEETEMKTILERLKSPVVLIQLASIIVGLVIFFDPSVELTAKTILAAIISIINIFAGLNNPENKEGF